MAAGYPYENIQADHGDLQLRLFLEYLPAKPYCTDMLEAGLSIAPAMQAIKRRYIQPNSPWDLRWLVYDIDRPTASYDWEDDHCPAPNIVVLNQGNGHAHLLYGLEVPVYKQPEAHPAPLRYAAAVDVALSVKLEADCRYTKFICKNPLHKHWSVRVYQQESYDLGWLADYLDLEPYRDQRKHLPPIGLGRNCTLFDVTRRWAYRRIREPGWLAGAFTAAVTEYADRYNQTRFPVPLPWAEVKATGKSIARWTFQNMSQAGFLDWCSRRGKAGNLKSQAVRRAKSEERVETIRAFKTEHPDMSNRMIAKVFACDETTIRRALKD